MDTSLDMSVGARFSIKIMYSLTTPNKILRLCVIAYLHFTGVIPQEADTADYISVTFGCHGNFKWSSF